jgi:chemotaxis family two-component system sensor kinase Cph1
MKNKTDNNLDDRFEDFFNNSPIGFHIFNVDRGVIEINDAELKMFGYSRKEIINKKSFDDLVIPEQHQQIEEHWQQIMTSGHVENMEYTVIRKDGKKIDVLINASARFDQDHNLINTRGNAIDITKQKEAKKQLMLQDRALISAANAIVITDQHGNILWTNPAFTKFTGYQKEEVIGKNPRILKSGRQSEEFYEDLWQTIRSNKIWHGELINKRKDGSFYAEEMTITPVTDQNDNITNFIGIKQDISERKDFENQQRQLTNDLAQKNNEMERLLRIVTHDLKSPLINISGFSKELIADTQKIAEYLNNPDSTPEDKSHLLNVINTDIFDSLNYIVSSVTKMDTLLKGLSQLAQAGSVELEIQPLNIDKIISNIISTVKFQTKQANAAINCEPLPKCVGDNDQINQVFTNLIGNAIKYLDADKEAQIDITGRIENNRSIYRVTDNGIGIPENHKDKIFDVFHRVDPNSPVSGQGLGLTAVRQILTRMKGHIWFESELSKGSTFFVSLPAVNP